MVIARVVKDVFIVAAKRTPFGTYGGKLMNLSAIDFQEIAIRSALQSANIKPELVSSTIIGNVFHATSDGAYLARHASLRVGIPIESPALVVNRMCGSGFQSIVSASQEIELQDSEIAVTGGAENMSLSPHMVRGIRFGLKLGQEQVLEDSLWAGLTDRYINTPMGVTAENLGQKYGISRADADAYAFSSQKRWKNAHDSGYFKEEISPITLKTKKGDVIIDTDEHPKPETTLESLAKLPSVFKKDGTVNAGNASGISDGAGCVILASESACKKHSLIPLARIAAYSITGCDPNIMGIGPVSAIQALLKSTKLQLSDINLVEINEAFATQYLAVEKALGLDREKTNINGGAIAIGHPVGASGSRIISHLVHHLKFKQLKFGIGSACIGGGQGIAVLVESL